MGKYKEFGQIAKEIYLSDEQMTNIKTLRILKEKHGFVVDSRTLRRWKKTDNWEEDRLQKYMTTPKLIDKLEKKQLELLESDNPDSQLMYAVNTLLKTLKEAEADEKRRDLISEPGNEDELTKLTNLRNTLIATIQTNIQDGKSAKEQLEELQKLDQVIQSSKKLRSETKKQKRVYMFCFDGKDHTQDVLDDLEKDD